LDSAVIRPDPESEFYTAERCYILEMSNSAADDSLSIARARVEPGITTTFHRVNDTVERFVVLDGQGTVEIAKNPPQSVRAGDVVLIPAGANQRVTNTGNGDLVFLALCTPRFRPENYEDAEAASSIE